ncbi:MAG: asparagine synthase (glutamine-hydrolyzing) [Acidobacteria bacterium]|mgnify:CR=1 FL=1|nr:MAG: asparagine synthase (glutamine-hydrolyzing) [Acidobacteriota bacterium]REK01492.1 MAG: asparagine synthase (glutamine-hydrolyzing) [Acidobacteriota bacterium]REK14448.1 MAG: asparagine synthase (glutamine-hydrolyzing) [Acidobacteriota bacterium]REK45163.1 MAG: asparagine synthase (glutamine-hydrolyzing) [Acidobacteriota bacterium]
MCGIAGIFGNDWQVGDLAAMVESQRHRGPDGDGLFIDESGAGGIGHNRLSIIDLSDRASQPMKSADGRYLLILNGEIYNYLELRRELGSEFDFRTESDTEVLLAAFTKWGEDCLDRLTGMFVFVIWDTVNRSAFAARDRFGVKPLYFHEKPDGTLVVASEIKAIHAAGIDRQPDEESWATYLSLGLYDHSENTFWKDIQSLPAGSFLFWKDGRKKISQWYDLAARVGIAFDDRSEREVREEYFELLKNSVELRFRSDVPVGINLSGGLDSSTLLGLVHEVQGTDSDVKAFTFVTGDGRYDELPWVERMLEKTNHPLVTAKLSPEEVPELAASVQMYQDEPFGGLPTLAYAKLFETAKDEGVTVLLDGNGMDEQWAGYDYYQRSANGRDPGLVQGMSESPVRPECLVPDLRAKAAAIGFPEVFPDRLRNTQYRDAVQTKIPRAMRFNDRISMRSSRELREPFLDHRLFELALKQSTGRKIGNGTGKKMLREIVSKFVPSGVSEAPKRPMQTPQREWLRGPLREWAEAEIEDALAGPFGGWFDKAALRAERERFFRGESDNSFYVWQWISVGLIGTEMSSGVRSTAARK